MTNPRTPRWLKEARKPPLFPLEVHNLLQKALHESGLKGKKSRIPYSDSPIEMELIDMDGPNTSEEEKIFNRARAKAIREKTLSLEINRDRLQKGVKKLRPLAKQAMQHQRHCRRIATLGGQSKRGHINGEINIITDKQIIDTLRKYKENNNNICITRAIDRIITSNNGEWEQIPYKNSETLFRRLAGILKPYGLRPKSWWKNPFNIP